MAQGLIRVEHIAGHIHGLPEIVSWVHAEWGHLMPDISYPELVSVFRERITPHQVPETLVALKGKEIVGTASIVKHDLSTRLELSPWLAAVYVLPEFRGMGVGSRLVRSAIAEVKCIGIQHFYLLTPDRTSFYARLGWCEFEKTAYRGENVTIMMYEFND